MKKKFDLLTCSAFNTCDAARYIITLADDGVGVSSFASHVIIIYDGRLVSNNFRDVSSLEVLGDNWRLAVFGNVAGQKIYQTSELEFLQEWSVKQNSTNSRNQQ